MRTGETAAVDAEAETSGETAEADAGLPSGEIAACGGLVAGVAGDAADAAEVGWGGDFGAVCCCPVPLGSAEAVATSLA